MATSVALWDDLLARRGARLSGLRSRRATRTLAPLPEDLAPAGREALARAGHRGALRTPGARRGRRRSAASTSSSPPARRAARRSRSTCPCWTRSRASRSSARSTSIRRRRSRRTSCARSAPSGCRSSAPRSTTATRATERRWQVRKWANLILTNPDMLHVGVLPHHDRWGDVLSNLAYVIVDEAHVYRGVFGSHVANVLRRLRRLARVYGAEPQFLLASATIANPGELGAAPARRRDDGDRRRRGAARRADGRALEPAAAPTRSSACAPARSARPRS